MSYTIRDGSGGEDHGGMHTVGSRGLEGQQHRNGSRYKGVERKAGRGNEKEKCTVGILETHPAIET